MAKTISNLTTDKKSSAPQKIRTIPQEHFRVHFVGVGGTGMAPLAEFAHHAGYHVSGSDIADTPTLTQLRKSGIKVHLAHSAANIDDSDLIVYSSAIDRANVEILEAKTRGLATMHRSDFLREIMGSDQGITIAGTHGKSSTSGLIAHMLSEMGLDPSCVIGGSLVAHGSGCLYGQSGLFVAEADESDGSFVKYDSYLGVITNIGLDHLDFYSDENEIYESFLQYAQQVSPDGCLILGWDNALCRKLGAEIQTRNLSTETAEGRRSQSILSFGFMLGCDVRCLEYKPLADGTFFRAVVERDIVECKIPSFGAVSVLNALAALTVARSLELDVCAAAAALASFKGVGRRLQVLYSSELCTIIDDYAHNPEKIRGAISAAREARAGNRLIVVFQPHRFSRLSARRDDFMNSFTDSDLVIVVPVYSAGESPLLNCGSAEIANEISSLSKVQAIGAKDLSHCLELLGALEPTSKGRSSEAITYLTVGAGDIWRVALELQESRT